MIPTWRCWGWKLGKREFCSDGWGDRLLRDRAIAQITPDGTLGVESEFRGAIACQVIQLDLRDLCQGSVA